MKVAKDKLNGIDPLTKQERNSAIRLLKKYAPNELPSKAKAKKVKPTDNDAGKNKKRLSLPNAVQPELPTEEPQLNKNQTAEEARKKLRELGDYEKAARELLNAKHYANSTQNLLTELNSPDKPVYNYYKQGPELNKDRERGDKFLQWRKVSEELHAKIGPAERDPNRQQEAIELKRKKEEADKWAKVAKLQLIKHREDARARMIKDAETGLSDEKTRVARAQKEYDTHYSKHSSEFGDYLSIINEWELSDSKRVAKEKEISDLENQKKDLENQLEDAFKPISRAGKPQRLSDDMARQKNDLLAYISELEDTLLSKKKEFKARDAEHNKLSRAIEGNARKVLHVDTPADFGLEINRKYEREVLAEKRKIENMSCVGNIQGN